MQNLKGAGQHSGCCRLLASKQQMSEQWWHSPVLGTFSRKVILFLT